jgi:biotin transport system substrate-specific component
MLALGAYLVAGAVGLPVFAGGAAGIEVLAGPTAGYLFGFVVAAGLVGWMRDRGHLARFAPTLAVMVAAHLVILSMGWGRLSADLGAGAAWDGGVAPFVIGGGIKSIVAAILIVLIPAGSRPPAPSASP